MKKISSILVAVLLAANALAQAPQKMSYQAVIRNNSNGLIVSSVIGMRISILQGSSTGTAVYVETQTPSTNVNGLVSLQIGAGAVVIGSFSAIDWAAGPYFIKTETDPTGGTSYSISGTSELISVPYALFSANGPANPLAWSKTGNSGITSTNFIGTTDAQDFIVKTNGSATANERLRFLSNGQISINKPIPLSGNVFSVFGNGASGLNNVGDYAINGFVSNATGAGVYGWNGGAGSGILGQSQTGSGVYGDGGAGSGILGQSQTGFGVYGFSASGVGGYFEGGMGAHAYVGLQYSADPLLPLTNYKILGNGAVSTMVRDDSHKNRILFCPEAPEVLFTDFGTGQLANGLAHITIDPLLSKNIFVDEKHPIKVFVQLMGDCKGVYVSSESDKGFDVIELAGGTSNARFSWQIVANRADEKDAAGNVTSTFAKVRFPIGPEKQPLPMQNKQLPQVGK